MNDEDKTAERNAFYSVADADKIAPFHVNEEAKQIFVFLKEAFTAAAKKEKNFKPNPWHSRDVQKRSSGISRQETELYETCASLMEDTQAFLQCGNKSFAAKGAGVLKGIFKLWVSHYTWRLDTHSYKKRKELRGYIKQLDKAVSILDEDLRKNGNFSFTIPKMPIDFSSS